MSQFGMHFGFREVWLCRAIAALTPIFEEAGYDLPPLRASIGWPSHRAKRTVAECWPRAASSIGVNEIFIAPSQDRTVDILDHLMHELVHAIDDCRSGHGPGFRIIATDVGLEGRMPEARAGKALRHRLLLIARTLGPIPHQRLCHAEDGQAKSADSDNVSGQRLHCL